MKKILAVIGLCLVAGCLGGYSPVSRFYNLQTADAKEVSPISNKRFSVGVETVSIPDYLDRPQMVVFENNTPQMGTAENDRWGDSLSAMVQRTVVDDVALYLPKAQVKSKIELAEKFDFLVDIQIVKMDFVWDNKAILEAWWYINDEGGNVIRQQKFYEEKNVGKDFDEFVKAESLMLGNMSKNIATSLAKIAK